MSTMKSMTFEEIQANLKRNHELTQVKIGSKQGFLLEWAYVMGLEDAGLTIPPAVYMMLTANRSVAGYVPSPK